MLPRIIAICGNPGSGKSTAQEMLRARHDYQPVDDGRALREIVSSYLGATWDQVTTGPGKAEMIEINGKPWMVRDALGQTGNVFEQIFGGDVICEMAMRASNISTVEPIVDLLRYSFGSVRRQQGHFYKKHGGIVVEIFRDSAGSSEFEFDVYDKAAVQYTIQNDGTLEDLEWAIARMLRWHETGTPLATDEYLHREVGWSNERGSYIRCGAVVRWDRGFLPPGSVRPPAE